MIRIAIGDVSVAHGTTLLWARAFLTLRSQPRSRRSCPSSSSDCDWTAMSPISRSSRCLISVPSLRVCGIRHSAWWMWSSRCRSCSTSGNKTETWAAHIHSRACSLDSSILPKGSRDRRSAKVRSSRAISAINELLRAIWSCWCPARLLVRSTRARESSGVTKSRHKRRRSRFSSPCASARAALITIHSRGMSDISPNRRA